MSEETFNQIITKHVQYVIGLDEEINRLNKEVTDLREINTELGQKIKQKDVEKIVLEEKIDEIIHNEGNFRRLINFLSTCIGFLSIFIVILLII